MIKTHLLAAVAASLLAVGLTASRVSAQPPSQPPTTGGIALLDVSRVFKEHARFNAEMNDMKAKLQAADAAMKQQADVLQQKAEELKELSESSRDYKVKEAEIAQLRANMQVNLQLQRKEFRQEEARIYHNVYLEVQREVQYFAQRYAISAVLQFNSEKVSVEQPDQVLREINKSVVWFAPQLDITNEILKALNGSQAAPTGTPPGRHPPYRPAGRSQGVPPRR